MIIVALAFSNISAQDKNLFEYSKSTLLTREYDKDSAADSLNKIVQQGGSEWAFVADDGSALAIWSGTIAKIDAKTGEELTNYDQYRFEIRNGIVTAFNVSQETYIRKSYVGAKTLSLKPVALLDKYRTLCANGPQAASGTDNDPLLKKTLYLAVIDDRQRGQHPNQIRSIKVEDELNYNSVKAIGFSSGKVILSVWSPAKTRFLAVYPKTLATKWIKPPKWTGFGADWRAINKISPQFHSRSQARWNSKSYFFAPARTSPFGAGFVWDGHDLRETGQVYLVAASLNGKFGWLADRQTGNRWLLQR